MGVVHLEMVSCCRVSTPGARFHQTPTMNKNHSRTTTLSSRLTAVALLLSLALLSGCASTSSGDRDPFEKYNRGMTRFNLKADEVVLQPVARGYKKVVPSPIRNGLHNFFLNLREPLNMVYDLLQGKWAMAGRDAGRFAINTTLGLGGVNDVASYMDLPRRDEDFGQVLAVWGVSSGPHLVLPLLGPSNIRDGIGLVPGYYYWSLMPPDTSPESTIATVVGIVDLRARLLGTEDVINLQPDKYLFLREAYRQRRALAISEEPASADSAEDDALLDELLDDN